MDILNILKSRRSIRKYKTKTVSSSLITKILEAGRWAPSGLNNQPWRFMVIKDAIRKEQLSGFTKYGHIIKGAAAVILIFIDHQAIYHRDKDAMAVGACIQNILLEAHSLGIGTCWLGEILNQKMNIRTYLNLPSNLELMAAISLGYSNEKLKKGRRQSLLGITLRRSNHAQ